MKPKNNEKPTLLEDPLFEDAIKADIFGLLAMVGLVYLLVCALRSILSRD